MQTWTSVFTCALPWFPSCSISFQEKTMGSGVKGIEDIVEEKPLDGFRHLEKNIERDSAPHVVANVSFLPNP